MSELITPKEYTPVISSLETQRAIKKIKDYFQQELAYGLKPAQSICTAFR